MKLTSFGKYFIDHFQKLFYIALKNTVSLMDACQSAQIFIYARNAQWTPSVFHLRLVLSPMLPELSLGPARKYKSWHRSPETNQFDFDCIFYGLWHPITFSGSPWRPREFWSGPESGDTGPNRSPEQMSGWVLSWQMVVLIPTSCTEINCPGSLDQVIKQLIYEYGPTVKKLKQISILVNVV